MVTWLINKLGGYTSDQYNALWSQCQKDRDEWWNNTKSYNEHIEMLKTEIARLRTLQAEVKEPEEVVQRQPVKIGTESWYRLKHRLESEDLRRTRESQSSRKTPTEHDVKSS